MTTMTSRYIIWLFGQDDEQILTHFTGATVVKI
jgi:hypothetical protein